MVRQRLVLRTMASGEDSLEAMRKEYRSITGKEVPKKMYKNAEWLRSKIHEADQPKPELKKFKQMREDSAPWLNTTESMISKQERLGQTIAELVHKTGQTSNKLTGARTSFRALDTQVSGPTTG
eukprot:SAG22_NODE_10_length_35702_cov_72.266992_7_plen_124_part_00